MADSVKVRLMRKLAEVLGAVPGIASVHRYQNKATDLDQVRKPALFFWDERETRSKRNRLAVGEIDLNIMVFIHQSPSGAASVQDLADNLQGLIHNAIIQTAELKGLAENIEEVFSDKQFPNDLYGMLLMSFKLTYCHVWGDAFSTAY